MMPQPTPPAIVVQQSGTPTLLAEGLWRVRFDVRNDGTEAVAILAAWLPHGKLRCEERAYDPPPTVDPGKAVQLDFDVRFKEPPVTVVENGFVILRVRRSDELWQVLTRLTVMASQNGAPSCKAEDTTAHRVGFSGS